MGVFLLLFLGFLLLLFLLKTIDTMAQVPPVLLDKCVNTFCLAELNTKKLKHVIRKTLL